MAPHKMSQRTKPEKTKPRSVQSYASIALAYVATSNNWRHTKVPTYTTRENQEIAFYALTSYTSEKLKILKETII